MTAPNAKPRAGEHTKEPWEIAGATHIWSRSEKANIASCSALRTIRHVGYAPPEIGDIDETAANARRIVACVNACEGLPVEELEQYAKQAPYTAYTDLKAERDALTAQKRELIEVLRAVIGSVPFSHMHLPLKTRIEFLLAK